MQFIVGDTHKIFLGPGKLYKIHILALIDPNQIVYKWYGRHKQWWHYAIEHKIMIENKIASAERRILLQAYSEE